MPMSKSSIKSYEKKVSEFWWSLKESYLDETSWLEKKILFHDERHKQKTMQVILSKLIMEEVWLKMKAIKWLSRKKSMKFIICNPEKGIVWVKECKIAIWISKSLDYIYLLKPKKWTVMSADDVPVPELAPVRLTKGDQTG